MIKDEAQLEKLISEIRRGTLVLSVLSQLGEEQYGYSLMQALTARGMEIDQGTLYPLLRRLEKQGLLTSDWRVDGPRTATLLCQKSTRGRFLNCINGRVALCCRCDGHTAVEYQITLLN